MDASQAPCHCQLCEMEAAGLGADGYLASIVGRIDESGWAVQAVPSDEHGPSWAYSVGLWHTFHAPEFAIFGLPLANMAGIINRLGDYVADGARFEAGDRIDGVCPRALTIRSVDATWRHTTLFAVSDTVYGLLRPPCLQIVWPDRDERFPWEREFDTRFEGRQPMLWLPRDDNPPSEWTRIDDHPRSA